MAVIAVLVVVVAGGAFVALTSDLGPPEDDLVDAVRDCDTEAMRERLAEDDTAPSPFTDAVRCDLSVLRLLLESGVDVTSDNDVESPLYVATQEGNDEVSTFLVEHGADAAWRGPDGETAMHVAAQHGDTALVQTLIDAGGSVDTPSSQHQTPLFRAVGGGHVETSCVLLAAGADPSRRVSVGWLDVGVFLVSLDRPHQAQVLEAVGPSFGLDVDVDEGENPISAAIDALDSPLADQRLFLTPLYVAVLRESPELVNALLDAGADQSIEVLPARQTPLEAAELLANEPIVASLRGAVAP